MWAGALATAQPAPDRHLEGVASNQLFRLSVFAHGYMHGYEDGFHWGDVDLQTGREPRAVSTMTEYRSAKDGYQPAFGNRKRFREGYLAGFCAGYADAIGNHSFRAVATTVEAAAGLAAGQAPPDVFDSGFGDGYELGTLRGAEAARLAGNDDPRGALCIPGSVEERSHSPGYCAAFLRGYNMGYSDGYVGQAAEARLAGEARK